MNGEARVEEHEMRNWRSSRLLQIGRVAAEFWVLGLLVLGGGCASSGPAKTETRRPFSFQTDTFAYANELVWDYGYDEKGKWTSHAREPKPNYTHHCFVVARSARQFFEHARFDATQPMADEETYGRLIRRVLSSGPSHRMADADKVVIPGYADLHSFSQAEEQLLKAECGGAWQSYFQHGHWRMILPFSRHEQEHMAEQLVVDLKEDRPPVVHLVRFPQLTINHAVVLFQATEEEKEIRFEVYDPNNPKRPVELRYDRESRTFELPANDYFRGGRVDVYEVYRNWRY